MFNQVFDSVRNKINEEEIPLEMENRIATMAQLTWDTVVFDIFDGLNEVGDVSQLTPEEVVSYLIEKDDMLVYGEDEDAYEYLQALSPEYSRALLIKAFPGGGSDPSEERAEGRVRGKEEEEFNKAFE